MKKTFTSRCFLPALLLGCSLLATAPPAYAQGPWTWSSQSVSTSPGRAWAEQNAVDAAGDVYVTGAFVGTVNFPGAGTLNSMGNSQDTFVGKLNGVTGVWMWVTQGLDPGVGSGYGICVDNAGSVYVTGKFEGTFVIFPPMPPLPGSGGNDVFVAKFDANTGQCVDRVAGGGANGNDVGRSIAWLPQIPGTPPGGLLFVTGEFTSPVAIFGSGGVGNAGGGGTSDIFVSQLSAAVLNWNNTISVGGGGDDRGQGITVAPSPSASTPPFVYVTGGFESGTIVFGGTPLTNYGSSFSDIYVGKLDVGLTWQWVSQAGGIGRDEGMDVTYDPVSADVYTTGHFEALASTAGTVATFGSFSFAPSPAYGGTDIFVARLKTPTGLWAWARQAGGVNDDTGYAIDQDPSGRIYATGTFTSGPGLFGPTTLPNTAAGIGDVFISKLANMGGWMWSRADGGPGHDEGKGIALAGPSTVFASGGFFASAQFSPFTLTSVSRDAWVGRLPGTLPNLVVNTPMNVPPGGYQNITVTGTGVAILTGPVFAAGNVIVQNGGVWTSNCNILTGPGNFQLQAGGTINICSPQGISLSGPTGDIQVTGTRSYSTDATYRYVNPGGAQITGNGLAGARNLDIVTSGGVTLTQPVSVRRQMTFVPGSGNLALAGNALTMLSNATQTAMIVNSSPAVGATGASGRHERYVDGSFSAGNGYRYISTPMVSSVVSDLACPGFTPVVNPAFDAQTNPTPSPFPRVYGYDETLKPTNPTFAYGWYSPPSLATPMTPGRALSAFMSGGRKPTFRGTFRNGNVNVGPMTQTGGFLGATQKSGWHLLGNPYPSPIDWDLASIPAGMSPTISVWRSTGGSTGFYVNFTAGSGPGQWLPVGQGFFARVLVSGPVFTFTNLMRATSFISPPYYSRPLAANRPEVRLTLAAAGAAEVDHDETQVFFTPGASSEAFDNADGERPGHNVGQPTLLSLAADGTELALNALPETMLAAGARVPLLLDLPAPGTYELGVGQLANLAGTGVTLVDHLTGTHYDLHQLPVISLRVARAGEVRGRFELVVGQRVTGLAAEGASPGLRVWPNPARGTVWVEGVAGQVVEVSDLSGRRIWRGAEKGAGRVMIEGLAPGVYVVRRGEAWCRMVIE